jgi:hypothetical protein
MGRWGDPTRAHGPGMRSCEARAARRGEPRQWFRALAERSGDEPALGPAPEGQTKPEDQDLQGISAESQSKHWVGQGC